MERKKVEIQSSDPSALASDRFNFILVSERCLSVSVAAISGLVLCSLSLANKMLITWGKKKDVFWFGGVLLLFLRGMCGCVCMCMSITHLQSHPVK